MTQNVTAAVWLDEDGNALSCVEKLKVLEENLDELEQVAQDAFEDALLIGVQETQIRERLAQKIAKLTNPYRNSK